jgi:uncharacterized protein
MLTKEQGIVRYKDGQVFPDRLDQRKHARYVAHAERMIELYRRGIGKTRRELHEGVRRNFEEEPECPARRIDAFCKLLDEVSDYDTDRGGKSAALRQKVFRLAAPLHPLVATRDKLFEQEERVVKDRIAKELGKTWEEIDQALFADVIEFNRLRKFTGYLEPRDLLSR